VKCIDAKKMIDQYLDGELSPIRSRAFESHCTQCSSCANELALAKKIRKTLKAFPVVKAPKGFESKVHARISKREKRTFAKIFFYPRHIKIPLEVAALFVIALLVTIHPDSIMFGDKIMKESSPDAQMKWENEVPSVAEDKMAPSAPRAVSKSKTARKEIAGKDRSFHADKFAGSNPPSPAKDL
jgi:anti-sigma factor RsiW